MKARDWPCAINLFARILIQDDGALVEDPFITSDGAKIVLIAGFDLVVAAMIAGEQSPASTSPSLARIINR